LNLARIVSLFAVGIVAPDFFDALHHDIWQAAFIFIALAIWAGWAVWATRRPSAAIHAET
jgi:hypothetical protein